MATPFHCLAFGMVTSEQRRYKHARRRAIGAMPLPRPAQATHQAAAARRAAGWQLPGAARLQRGAGAGQAGSPACRPAPGSQPACRASSPPAAPQPAHLREGVVAALAVVVVQPVHAVLHAARGQAHDLGGAQRACGGAVCSVRVRGAQAGGARGAGWRPSGACTGSAGPPAAAGGPPAAHQTGRRRPRRRRPRR
jgi:hypothetical protein